MKSNLKKETDRMILGQGCVYSSDCSKTGLNNNCLVVGTSGSGKTLSVTVPAILEAENKSLIITVSKRAVVDIYSPLLKERGFDVQILDIAQPSKSTVGYDPLKYADNMRDINFLIRSLVYADARKQHSQADPYFDDTAVSLGDAFAAYVKVKCKEKGFSEVCDMIRNMKFRKCGDSFVTAYDDVFEDISKELEKKKRAGEEALLTGAPKSSAQDREKDAHKGGLAAKTEGGGSRGIIKIPDVITAFVDEDYDDENSSEEKTSSDDEFFDECLKKLIAQMDSFPYDDSMDEFPVIASRYDKSSKAGAGDEADAEDDDETDAETETDDDITSCGFKYNGEKVSDEELLAFAVGCWDTFSALPFRTGSCVYSSLSTVMDTLFTSEIKAIMQMKKTVDMHELANKKTVLFVITSPVNSSFNFFVNLFYSHIIKELFEYAERQPSGRLPLPVHMICDDFATGGRIKDFPEYISILREKGISVTLLIQSESQLASMYGDNDATTIINNCDTYVYFGGMDLATCKNISLRLNSPLEDVLYLPPGKEIVFRRGSRPVVTERYHIYEDERYKRAMRLYKGKEKEGGR